MKNLQASLVIPLFNNAKTLEPKLKECETILKTVCLRYEIIVGEDKSTDTSGEILKTNFSQNPHFKLIFNSKNLGIAKNIKNLYKAAKYPYVVLFSVDGDWNPKDIAKLLSAAQKQKADIVIGKRNHKNYPLTRTLISFFYNFFPLLLFGVKTEDAGSIKVIKKELITSTHITSKSIFSEAELIIRTKKKGKTVLSVPISFKRKSNKGTGGKLDLVIMSIFDLIRLRLYYE